jgi:hypothetical protein
VSELREPEDMESYNVTNSITFSTAKYSIEQRGGKVVYYEGDLYIEWPDQKALKVTPVFIQGEGWRYPIDELGLTEENDPGVYLGE